MPTRPAPKTPKPLSPSPEDLAGALRTIWCEESALSESESLALSVWVTSSDRVSSTFDDEFVLKFLAASGTIGFQRGLAEDLLIGRGWDLPREGYELRFTVVVSYSSSKELARCDLQRSLDNALAYLCDHDFGPNDEGTIDSIQVEAPR